MDQPRGWLGLQAILLTIVLTLIGVVFASESGGTAETWLAAPVYLGALASIIVIRLQALPAVTRNQGLPPQQRSNAALVLSFSATLAMAVFGLVSLLIGKGWIAIPFGPTALMTWVLLSRYTRLSIES